MCIYKYYIIESSIFFVILVNYTYSRVRVSSPIPTLHTAITRVIIVLELYYIVSDCSVQCANMAIARNPEMTVSIMCLHIIKYKSIDINYVCICLCMSCSHNH